MTKSTRTPPLQIKKSFPDRATAWIGSVPSLLVHTMFFALSFFSIFLGAKADTVMLVLTTVVSLEAIYLAIFIQISVNRNTADIAEIQSDVEGIEADIEEIAEDVEDIAEDVEGIEKDIEEIQADVEGIEADIEEISDDVEGIEKDIDGIAEDIEEIEESIEEDETTQQNPLLSESQQFILESILREIQELKTKFESFEQENPKI